MKLANRFPKKLLPFNLPMLPHTAAIEAATGLKMTFGRLKHIGERGYNLERLCNIKLGLTFKEDDLPKRLKEELQNPDDPNTKVPLEKMKKAYYKSRGWSGVGIPDRRRLQGLGLSGGEHHG